MTMPAPDTARDLPEFATDAEIAERWGVSEVRARAAIRAFERQPLNLDGKVYRFPEKDPLLSHKRLWAAVQVYILARAGLTSTAAPRGMVPDAGPGSENHSYVPSHDRRRSRPHLAHNE